MALFLLVVLSYPLLAADKEDIISKFFTYEDRLEVQKYLKESLAMKAIAKALGKDPTTISREIKSIHRKLPPVILDIHSMNVRIENYAVCKRFAVKIALINQQCTAKYVGNVTNTARTL